MVAAVFILADTDRQLLLYAGAIGLGLETVANTCLEALSCGTPLLGFRICGIPYSADAPYGTFVAPEDVDGLAEAIRNTPPKTAERSAACRHYAESRYDAQQYYERLASLTKDPFYG